MNFSLISSFVIGSILVLSLVHVNMNLFKSSMESMSDHVSKVNIDAVANVITHDFVKIGYGVAGNSLQEATATKLVYQSDLDDDGVVEEVKWEFDKAQMVNETTNPNDYLLTRTINGVSTPIKLGVVNFSLSYYDKLNNPTSILSEVRKVNIEILCESLDPIGDKYMKAAWEKSFMPLSI